MAANSVSSWGPGSGAPRASNTDRLAKAKETTIATTDREIRNPTPFDVWRILLVSDISKRMHALLTAGVQGGAAPWEARVSSLVVALAGEVEAGDLEAGDAGGGEEELAGQLGLPPDHLHVPQASMIDWVNRRFLTGCFTSPSSISHVPSRSCR